MKPSLINKECHRATVYVIHSIVILSYDGNYSFSCINTSIDHRSSLWNKLCQLFIQFFEVVSICYYNNDFPWVTPMTTFQGISSLTDTIKVPPISYFDSCWKSSSWIKKSKTKKAQTSDFTPHRVQQFVFTKCTIYLRYWSLIVTQTLSSR